MHVWQIYGCGFMHRLSLYSPCTMYTYNVQPVERLIVLERAALQLDVFVDHFNSGACYTQRSTA